MSERVMTPEEALRAIARLRRIERAAKEWARCQRGAWPRTTIDERDPPGSSTVSQSDLRRSELALLAVVETEAGRG